MARDNTVTLYYIGVHFATAKRSPIFNHKGKLYRVGKIGEPVLVAERDADGLIKKGRVEIRGKGTVESFTRDPNIAAAVKRRFETGDKNAGVTVNLSMQDAVGLLTPDMLKEQISSKLSVAELEALLKQMQGEDEPVEDKPVLVDVVDAPVTSRNKNKKNVDVKVDEPENKE